MIYAALQAQVSLQFTTYMYTQHAKSDIDVYASYIWL